MYDLVVIPSCYMVFSVNCCLNLPNMGGDIKYGCIGHGASCFMPLHNESLNSKKQFDFSKISLGNSGKLLLMILYKPSGFLKCVARQ